MTNQKHGGKRKGAGRPATGKNETTVIRVDVMLVPIISEIRAEYRKTKSLDNLINVTGNQDGKLLAANEKLRIKCDKLSVTNIEKNKEINLLKSQIAELERVVALDGATLDRLMDNKPSNDNHAYDGNAKGFREEVERITGISTANRSKLANKLKSTYAELNITPKKNGRLSSDAERIAVIEWLRDNHN